MEARWFDLHYVVCYIFTICMHHKQFLYVMRFHDVSSVDHFLENFQVD